MKAVVTGATGAIGMALLEVLEKNRIEILVHLIEAKTSLLWVVYVYLKSSYDMPTTWCSQWGILL